MNLVEAAKRELAQMAQAAKDEINANFDRIARDQAQHVNPNTIKEWDAWMAAHPFPDKFKHLLRR